MLDINFGEYLIIFVVALLVFGPERLPEISRKAGGWIRDMRVMANEFRGTLEDEMSELKEPLDELREEAKKLGQEFKDEARKLTSDTEKAFEWKGPTHSSGPTHADAMQDLEAIDNKIAELDPEPKSEPSPEVGGAGSGD